MKLSSLLGLLVLTLIIGVSSASAQNVSADAYGGSGTKPAQIASGGVGSERAVATNEVRALDGKSLPFTGFDVLLFGVGGIALLGLGLGLRRMTVQPHHIA